MKRRNKKRLEENILLAQNKKEKALAYYELGLFHDNNARESEAIPNYLLALKIGLNHKTKPKALAWLASSFYKTKQPKKALASCHESKELARDSKLKQFLTNLEKRIRRLVEPQIVRR